MTNSITSANAVLMLGVANLFPVPQKIEGFSADDVFDSEDVETAEVMMGVDGKLSAGFVFNPVVQGVTLNADSPSNTFFEAVNAAERAAREKYFFSGTILLPATQRSYTLTKGVMSGFKAFPDAKKVLQPRKFKLTWESVTPATA